MMETTYEITISLKSINDWISFGRFLISHDKDYAITCFESLTGKTFDEELVLRLDLIENTNSKTSLLECKSCTLGELSENIRIITRDAFKYFTLEQTGK